MKHKTKIYLANGLFGVADRMFNDVIYKHYCNAKSAVKLFILSFCVIMT